MPRITTNWMLAAMLGGGCYTGVHPMPSSEDAPDDPLLDDEPDEPPPAVDDESECDPDALDSGPTQLRRLSRSEYENTVQLVLGVDPSVIPPFLPDERPAGFEANFAHVGSTRAQEYQSAAIAIADAVEPSSLAGCSPADGITCAEAIIRSVAPRLQRRSLTDDELSGYLTVYEQAAELDPEQGIRAAIEAMLQSPHFIYHVQIGEADDATGRLRLRPMEIAARLSYFFWDEPPDAELLQAADSGALRDRSQVEAQARRLLEDPKARPFLARFFIQWFSADTALAEKTNVTEGLTPALADSMLEEVHRLVERVVFEQQGTWPDLLRAETTQFDEHLADLYGIAPPESGWEELTWDEDQRQGLLSLPAILAAQSGADARVPIRQGRLTLETLLCTPVPAPPEGAVGKAPPKEPDMTQREYSELLIEIEGCDACHGTIEPVGWIFGHYDPLGRFVDTEVGKPIDASGQIAVASEEVLRGPIDGLVELTSRMADSESVQQCMVQHAFSYVHGRSFAKDDDRCSRDLAEQALVDSGGDLIEMFVALTTSEAFLRLGPMEMEA